MKKALHPETGKQITVAEYKKDFGNDAPIADERPICPICKQKMMAVAASAPGTTAHFAHLPKSSFCPTKEASGM
jgi:hypothetical protein